MLKEINSHTQLANDLTVPALYIFMIMLVPCVALHINMETLLVVTGQDPRVAKYEQYCGQ